MKTITNEQIKLILDVLMQLNIPVQAYANLDKLFKDLPEVKKDEKGN